MITHSEFASSCLAYLIDDFHSDPVPILDELPDEDRALVVAEALAFAEIDYYYPPPEGGSDEIQREYQSQARRVCEAILRRFATPE